MLGIFLSAMMLFPQTEAFSIQPMEANENKCTYQYILPTPEKNSPKAFSKIITVYESPAKQAVHELKQRINKEGQFLNWASLPETQLKSNNEKTHLDRVYAQANELVKRAETPNRPLVVLGIGGSKHPSEFLLNMAGYKRSRQVFFYSDIDPVSFSNFLLETGNKIENLNFLVVSKSGTTFETLDAFKKFEQALFAFYKSQNLSNEEALKKAQAHFAICTDVKATSKNLRGKIGFTNGKDNPYIKELYIHDDVGGRFSMFDDATLFVAAYAGIERNFMHRVLQGAINANDLNLNAKNIHKNPAILAAIFQIYAKEKGYHLTYQQYFGKLFEGAGENWAKQLYLESLKDLNFEVSKAPDSMHYAAEGLFSADNRKNYNAVLTIMDPTISENYKKYTAAIAQTYAETSPVKIEILPIQDSAIQPEAIGEYIQTKYYETLYTGILRRLVHNKKMFLKQLPEVLQPAVETYKNKFKQGSPFELNPGK